MYGEEKMDLKQTIITREQYNRIVSANETSASGVHINFFDTIQQIEGQLVSGSRPRLNGYYYILTEWIPKTNLGRTMETWVLTTVTYGNTNTGQMTITFYSNTAQLSSMPNVISLRNNRNEYLRQKNQFIRLVNGE